MRTETASSRRRRGETRRTGNVDLSATERESGNTSDSTVSAAGNLGGFQRGEELRCSPPQTRRNAFYAAVLTRVLPIRRMWGTSMWREAVHRSPHSSPNTENPPPQYTCSMRRAVLLIYNQTMSPLPFCHLYTAQDPIRVSCPSIRCSVALSFWTLRVIVYNERALTATDANVWRCSKSGGDNTVVVAPGRCYV